MSYPDTHDYDAHMYLFIHDTCFYDACIHDVMHVSMRDVSMILDPDTCMYDAYIYPDTHEYDAHMYDAFIHDD